MKHAEDVLDAMLPVMDIRPRNVLDVNNDGRIDHRDLIAMCARSCFCVRLAFFGAACELQPCHCIINSKVTLQARHALFLWANIAA